MDECAFDEIAGKRHEARPKHWWRKTPCAQI
jgi:hypothetical protein